MGQCLDSYIIQRKDARIWSTLCHISGLVGFVIPVAGCIIGPLIVWLFKKNSNPFVNYNGKESMNFQISMLIYGAIAFLLNFVQIFDVGVRLIGLILLLVVSIIDIILVFIAAIKAGKGEAYRYPLTIRFIK
ncbi:MAG: DUF4870 domain-containing protein [Planctomycetota bacterium]